MTVVGRSGVGKSRLAVEVARQVGDDWPGGAVYVELAGVGSLADVGQQIGLALGTGVTTAQPAEDAIRHHLRHAPVLLVIDDIDHLATAVDVILELASLSPETRVLGTAHRPLGHPLERVVRLKPLPVAGPDVTDARALAAWPAVALYVERSARVDPTFELTAANAADIAAVARSLDGLPLAIELGAARAGILTPSAQVSALRDHTALELRSSRRVGARDRHRDLRSSIEATHALAGDRERLVLRRMSVFAAPCTAANLLEVAGEAGWTLADLLDTLVELVDLGLTEVDRDSEGEPRYRLLPTIGAFAHERLTAAGEDAAVAGRHAITFQAAAAATRSLADRPRLAALGRDALDLHAAFGRLVHDDDATAALRLAADLAPLWLRTGLFQGTRRAFEDMLDSAERPGSPVPPDARARAALWWTRLVMVQPASTRDRALVVRRLDGATQTARDLADEHLLLVALDCVVLAVFITGDLAGAAAATAQGLALATELGERGAQTRFEYRTAMVAAAAGDFAGAASWAGRALEQAMLDGDLSSTIRATMLVDLLPPGVPGVPSRVPGFEALLEAARGADDPANEFLLYPRLAWNNLRAGDPVAAATWILRGLATADRLGAWFAGGACTAILIAVAADRRDDEVVARLHGSMLPILAEVMVGLGPAQAAISDTALSASRERLGSATFERLVAEGSLLDGAAALELARAYAASVVGAAGGSGSRAESASDEPRTRPVAARPDPQALSRREMEVLRMMATGATNAEIGEALGLRPKTVMHYSVSLYGKLAVRGRAEAVAWGYRAGLLD